MSSSFRQTVSVTRYAAGSYVKGRWTEGTSAPLTITASVQPVKPDEMQLLPEGRRESMAFALFTDSRLFPAATATGKNADRVTLYGSQFEIVACDIWQNNVIPHYKALAVRLGQ